MARSGQRSSPHRGDADRMVDPPADQQIRIDAWLVAVRLVKTRSVATQACRAGHVKINGHTAKPASPVAVGDQVEAYLHQRLRVVEVIRLLAKRASAPIAHTCYVDHSPPPPPRTSGPDFAVRERGAGRPTKKDRRQIDRLRGRDR